MSAHTYGIVSGLSLVFGVVWFILGNDRSATIHVLVSIVFALWEITEHIKRGAR